MTELEDLGALRAWLAAGRSLHGVVLQDLDLRHADRALDRVSLEGCVLLGCALTAAQHQRALAHGAIVFPRLAGLPFRPYRGALYTPEELYGGFDPGDPSTYAHTPDARIHQHWLAHGGPRPHNVLQALARRLHDFSISDALDELLEHGQRVVAFMGGHGMPRGSAPYRAVAQLARRVTEAGFLVATGGGPGAMEAAHLGACCAGRAPARLDDAIDALVGAPDYTHPEWLSTAMTLRRSLQQEAPLRASLGVPTWTFGHEPPTPFASHIAKYFANSVREDGLLSIAHHGVVFAPGSAGTLQEVFQDATQNHYELFGHPSPMIFLGRSFWEEERPAVRLLTDLAGPRRWSRWILTTDDPDEVLALLGRYAASADAPGGGAPDRSSG